MRYALAAIIALCACACAAPDHEAAATLGESGLRFSTSDQKFSFNMTTAVMFQYTYHDVRAQGGGGGTNGADFSNFRVTSARSFFTGHIFDRQFQYRMWLVWSSPADTFRIEDAFFRWAPLPLLNITIGQMRVPASWEYLVDHERTGLPERSIADSAFQQGWGKGGSLSGRVELWEAAYSPAVLTWDLGIYNGVLDGTTGSTGSGAIAATRGGGSNIRVTDARNTEQLRGGFRNNDWHMRADNFNQFTDGDLMIAGRIELHAMGEIPRHMVDINSIDDTAAWFVMVGAAVSWFNARTDGVGTFLGNMYHNAVSATGTGTILPPTASGRPRVQASIFHATVDGHFRWIGLSINWALHYRHVDFAAKGRLDAFNLEDDPAVANAITDRGATVDVGYFVLSDELCLLARFSVVDFDEFESRVPSTGQRVDGDSFGPDSYEYGGAITWFVHGDNLKISLAYRQVAQQLPHGSTSGSLLSGTKRTPDWRNFQEVTLLLQWIF
jgi:hypothetical protein